MFYQHVPNSHLLCIMMETQKKKCTLNLIILIEEINQLFMFNVCCKIHNYVDCCSTWPPVIAMHRQTSFKTTGIAFIYFHDCSIWQQHCPRWVARVYLLYLITPDALSPSYMRISRNQGVPSLMNGVATPNPMITVGSSLLVQNCKA
jgi:hypothetical protein